jgi:hypothetical protein
MKYLQKLANEGVQKRPWFPAVFKKYEELADTVEMKYQHEIIHLPSNKSRAFSFLLRLDSSLPQFFPK